MLVPEKCGLIVVDVQGSLALNVSNSAVMIANIERLIKCCQILHMPIIWLEQYPKGLGSTVNSIASLLAQNPRHEKVHFNALLEHDVEQSINDSTATQWLVTGIEAHICVYQTVCGLLERHHHVEVVTDAISSRNATNVQLAINKMNSLGAQLTSVEMAVYELLLKAGTPEFKAILPIIK